MDPKGVIKLQRQFQAQKNVPIYMRGRGPYFVYPFFALFTVTGAASVYYLGRAILGIKDEKK